MNRTPIPLGGELQHVSPEAVDALRADVRGSVLTPAEGYADVRRPFNAMHVDRPALVVRCAGTADVAAAVTFAREQGIEVTVRGGGHSIAGLSSTDGGMVIDLSSMRAVDVDPATSIARVQGGAVLGDVDRETQVFGLATPLGGVSETGVAGLTLGGGYGWLRRKFGLACDSVLAAQVVLADGRVVTASADSNQDLFWALRGGGGNFGVVTSFTFRLHPLGPTVAFAGVFYPLAEAAGLLAGVREFIEDAPDEITVEIIPLASALPDDPHLPEPVRTRRAVIVGAVYAGDANEGMKALQPLRELATPLADISQPMPFTAVQTAFDGFFPRDQLQAYWKAQYVRELSSELVELIAERAEQRPPARSVFELTYFDLFPMGGAVNRVAPTATAFAQRSAPWLVSVGANWTDPAENEQQIAWVRESWDAVDACAGTGAMYLNFTGRADEPAAAHVERGHASNLGRLAEIKRTYDPDNFFRRNNNIAPA